MKDKELAEETIRYLIVGVITTVVAYVILWLFYDKLGIEKNLSNLISNAITIIIAYILNRVFVFKSRDKNIAKESIKFIVSRVVVALIDQLLFFILTLFIEYVLLVKVMINIIVIILNYIFSKLFVFKNTNKFAKKA